MHHLLGKEYGRIMEVYIMIEYTLSQCAFSTFVPVL